MTCSVVGSCLCFLYCTSCLHSCSCMSSAVSRHQHFYSVIISLVSQSCVCLQPTDVNRNYLWAALMFVFPLFGAIAYVHSSRLSIIVQIQLRAELTAAVYRKALRLSSRYACAVTDAGHCHNNVITKLGQCMYALIDCVMALSPRYVV